MKTLRAGARSAFTLIEILAVLVILAILSTLLVTNLVTGRELAEVEATRRLLARIEATLDHYEREFGDYPPSSFRPEQGVANEGANVGAEALVVALWSRGWEAGGLLDDVADALVNLDGDRSSEQLSDFGSRELFEIGDAWGNPVAYLHHQDYERRDRSYLTLDPATGEQLTSFQLALRQADTGRFARATRFQLCSAGPDGLFDTPDDVSPFER